MRALRLATTIVAVVAAGLVPVVAAPSASAETRRDRQWYLKTLDVAAAHKITQGAGVVVAVLDTGVGKHPDVDGQILDGVSLAPGEGTSLTDNAGHGSSMAGIIVAKGGNADHLLGIAPKAKVLSVRTSTGSKGMGKTNIPEGIRWAVDHGAKVINISEGGKLEAGGPEAVQYALDHDVVVVAGSGNVAQFAAGSGVIQPASIPGVVAVTAHDRNGNAWSGAITGPEVVLSAPGVAIPSVSAAGGGRVVGYYESTDGTSNSTAVVSGAAALIRAKYPDLPAKDVIQRLISTADDAGAPGRDPQYGYGRLNLVKALTADVAPVAANPLLQSARSSGQAASAAPAADDDGLAPAIRLAAIAGGGVCLLLVVAGILFLTLRRRRA
ncbi:S8 family serine peptidase [Dactylosporangium sucinum]|uniref:Type VII secretion-associated serine protease n=1 Tax=Dactylosporangium sucinum TaxID=1424081 RepID=A0A917T075_9ACTN|nr:S8 family serine peptidase [Dactylosporangium sucinum]GGM05722.1 type VII secretion-associated serine protease [Dactylosporangium sucinum]